MGMTRAWTFWAAVVVVAVSSSAMGQEVSADRVDGAVSAGLAFLYSRQAENGSWETAPAHVKRYGRGLAEAAVALAALEAGQTLERPELKKTVAYLAGLDPRTVQVRAARARVYARLSPKDYGDKLQADATWLIRQQQKSGGWGYGLDNPTTRADWTDATNTAAAVLALHEAADAGATVAPTVWRNAWKWWVSFANRDGGWGFDPPVGGSALRPDSYGSTTAAALVSLHVLQLRLAGENPLPKPPRRPNPPSETDRQILARGWGWVDQQYSLAKIPKYPAGLGEDYIGQYQLWLQQAARLSGWGESSGRPIHRELAAVLAAGQQEGGRWVDASVTAEGGGQPGASILPTALAVQCLARVRQSEAIGWLAVGAEFDAYGVENACRAVGRSLKTPVTWRRVLAKDVAQCGLPMVLMTWDGAASFGAELNDGLRRYLAAGGFVLVQPLGGDKKLAQQAADFLAQASPGLSITAVGADHPLRTIAPLPANVRVGLTGLRDFTGLRAAVLEDDVTGVWHIGKRMESSALLVNVLRYVTDSGELPSPFLARASSGASSPTGRVTGEIVVARVKLGEAWSGFPNAASHVGAALAGALSLGVRQAEAVELTRDVPAEIDLLWLPVSGKFSINDTQRQTLAKFLRAGGTLFLDAATGEAGETQTVLELAQALCGPENVRELPADHALLTGALAGGSGADVTKPAWTAVLQNGRQKPRLILHGGTVEGKLRVLASPQAVTAPAAGPTLYGCRGLATPDARRLLCNVLLLAAERE